MIVLYGFCRADGFCVNWVLTRVLSWVVASCLQGQVAPGRQAVLHPPVFERFEGAYAAVLQHVGENFGHVIDARGNRARECLNLSFVVGDPRDRIVYVPARRTNIVFCFAEALWYLWGRDDLEMISYYAPGLARFSADGATLTGSAYGPRLFGPTSSGWSQWDQVLRLGLPRLPWRL